MTLIPTVERTIVEKGTKKSLSPGPVRVALIGCGAISQQMHLPILAGHEGLKLVALVDRDLGRATDLARAYGVATALDDMDQLADIDAAVLATPPLHHGPGSIALMRKGIHVLVEKPMALNLAEARAMVETARHEGVVLSVGYFRRLMPSMRLMKSLVESNRFGRPMRFEVEGGGFYTWGAATLANMRKDLAGGGVLIDFGSHMLDLVHFLFEGPGEVLDYADNNLGGIEADCEIKLRVRHQGQPVEGTVALARTRQLGSLVRVHCEQATLEYEITERYAVRVRPRDPALADPLTGALRDFELEAGWKTEEETSWFDTMRAEFDDWLKAMRTGRPPILDAETALATVKVIEDCYARSRRLAEPWVDMVPARTTKTSSNGELAKSHSPLVLLTGATGFIGARVAEVLALRDGWRVRALVHNPGSAARLARLPVEMIQGDLARPEDAARLVAGCDAVVHCAVGTAWGNRREIYRVTVDGTRHLAEAALAAGARRFVHLSTMSVYGDDGRLTGTIDETMPPRPTRGGEYGESKLAAEIALQKLAARGLAAVIFRPARVFGPFSRIFINRPIPAIAAGQFRWLGSPDVPCDMVYVDNVVEAIVRALEAPEEKVKGEVFNISDGDPMTWREFYGEFARALRLDLERAPVADPARQRRPGLARRIIGFPLACLRGWKTVLTSPEFKSLGRRILQTDPIGTLPRVMIARFPSLERGLRRLVKADSGPAIYRREPKTAAGFVEMGSGGALISIDKARRVLGYEPVVSRTRAIELTLDWIKYARLV
jgi:predicted dehydrogenase/nucleoside-diphosphate-sugar epimerase